MAQGRVAWGVFCRAWLPSPFFSVIAGCVEGVCLVNVWSSWGKRERDRENAGKNKNINSSSSAAHPGEEEEAQYHLK
jgi:hypothetical protein